VTGSDMPDKSKWASFEQLLSGDVYMRSILNEPVDFVVEEPKRETAVERARRKWLNRGQPDDR
jgi:hypothetical protein